ncbi:MAG: hypothetical protein RL026_1057 [Pseudomonadota bacterium]|jgi:NAD+ diphosphatase
MSLRPNPFSGGYLDRRVEYREQPDWFEAARRDPETLYLGMRGTAALLSGSPEVHGIAWLGADDPRVRATPLQRQLLLGWFRSRRCVLVQFDMALPESACLDANGTTQFAELRQVAGQLAEDEAGLLAYARALAVWRDNHQHCGRCGATCIPVRAGHVQQCTSCGHESFPRLDPAIIVLVHHEGRALLGRQASWPAGRYSTIAGFVEPGESLEDAVRREVLEETGIAVGAVAYHSSQPWPFPSSLMLGFVAEGLGGEPQPRDSELEDARWFTREQVRAGAILLPPAESISRRLIHHWLDGV